MADGIYELGACRAGETAAHQKLNACAWKLYMWKTDHDKYI